VLVLILAHTLITEITNMLNVNLVTLLVVDVPDQLIQNVNIVVHLISYKMVYVNISVLQAQIWKVTMVKVIHSMNVSHVTLLV
jgi:hypothetical protein